MKNFTLFLFIFSLFSSHCIAQGAWTQKTSLPGNTRIEAGGFGINGKGYVMCGRLSTAYYNDVWEYNPAGDTWTQKGNFPGAARREPVCFSANGKGYMTTGRDAAGAFKDIWEYDPSNDTWSQKTSYGGVNKRDASGCGVGTKCYLGTGQDPSNGTNYNDWWEFDPSNNTWTQKAMFPGAGRNAAQSLGIGTKAYLGLGRAGTSTYGDWYEFDPANNTWTQKTNFANGLLRDETVAFAIGNIGYVGTGFDGALKNDWWTYDPSNDTWAQVSSMAGNRDESAAFSAGGKGYVATGWNGTAADAALFEFDPLAIGIGETQNEISVSVFPNPSEGIINLKISRSSNVKNEKLEIYNIKGGKVFSKTIDSGLMTLDLSSQPSGIYFYKIESENKTLAAGKLIISNN